MPFEISMFWKEFGIYTTAIAVLFWFIWRVFIKKSLAEVLDDHTKAVKHAILTGESIQNPKYNKDDPSSRKYISRHDIITEVKGIEDILEHRCGNCPVPAIIQKQVNDFFHGDFSRLQRAIDDFVKDVGSKHSEIHLTIAEQKKINELILNRFDIFASEFGSKGLATIDRLASFIAGKVHDRPDTK